jgi:hypothetical protein
MERKVLYWSTLKFYTGVPWYGSVRRKIIKITPLLPVVSVILLNHLVRIRDDIKCIYANGYLQLLYLGGYLMTILHRMGARGSVVG